MTQPQTINYKKKKNNKMIEIPFNTKGAKVFLIVKQKLKLQKGSITRYCFFHFKDK